MYGTYGLYIAGERLGVFRYPSPRARVMASEPATRRAWSLVDGRIGEGSVDRRCTSESSRGLVQR